MTNPEELQAIDLLIKGLAFVQEVTKLGKQDPTDFASPEIPLYVYKKQLVTGELRDKMEAKLAKLIDSI